MVDGGQHSNRAPEANVATILGRVCELQFWAGRAPESDMGNWKRTGNPRLVFAETNSRLLRKWLANFEGRLPL